MTFGLDSLKPRKYATNKCLSTKALSKNKQDFRRAGCDEQRSKKAI